MTDIRLTQGAVEQWARATPAVQVTQVAIEQWATVATGNTQMLATQAAVEQWASVALAGASQAYAMVLA